MVKQQRNGGDELCERRMLGIDAVVAAPVPVARENVDAFVNSLRFVPRSKCKFRRKNQEQRGQHMLASPAGNQAEVSYFHRRREAGILAPFENCLGASRLVSGPD